jgi:hypothetical protein
MPNTSPTSVYLRESSSETARRIIKKASGQFTGNGRSAELILSLSRRITGWKFAVILETRMDI